MFVRMPPAGKYTLLISAFWKNTKTDLNKTEEEDYFLNMAAKMNIAELEKAYAILSDAEKKESLQ